MPVDARALYIDLLKKCLTFALWDGADGSIQWNRPAFVERAVRTAAKVIKGDDDYRTARHTEPVRDIDGWGVLLATSWVGR